MCRNPAGAHTVKTTHDSLSPLRPYPFVRSIHPKDRPLAVSTNSPSLVRLAAVARSPRGQHLQRRPPLPRRHASCASSPAPAASPASPSRLMSIAGVSCTLAAPALPRSRPGPPAQDSNDKKVSSSPGRAPHLHGFVRRGRQPARHDPTAARRAAGCCMPCWPDPTQVAALFCAPFILIASTMMTGEEQRRWNHEIVFFILKSPTWKEGGPRMQHPMFHFQFRIFLFRL